MRDYASCSWFHAGAQAALIGMNSRRFLPRSHTAFSHGLSQIKSLPWVGSCKPKSWTGLYPPATLQDCTRGKNEAWKGKTSSEERAFRKWKTTLYIFFRKVCRNSTFGKVILKYTWRKKTQEPQMTIPGLLRHNTSSWLSEGTLEETAPFKRSYDWVYFVFNLDSWEIIANKVKQVLDHCTFSRVPKY